GHCLAAGRQGSPGAAEYPSDRYLRVVPGRGRLCPAANPIGVPVLDVKSASAPPVSAQRLPKLAAPGRRMLLAGLLALGVAAGLLSIAIGWLIGQLSASISPGILGATLGLVGGFFLAKYAERVFAEKLGQHYVAQLRRGLIAHALRSARGPSMGITIARSTNDLSSIRNWIVQGM